LCGIKHRSEATFKLDGASHAGSQSYMSQSNMFIHNADIASVFGEIADLLEIQGANQFRVRAYRGAARIISGLATSVQTLLDQPHALTDLPGIGADLAGKIGEIVATGTCRLREQLRAELPPLLHQLLTVPGLGPKRVRRLYEECQVQTIEQLAEAARSGRISSMRGFGRKTEQKIADALQARRSKARRFLLADAERIAAPLLAHLRTFAAARQVELAGSLRRARDTVGDLDLLVCSSAPDAVVRQFTSFEDVVQIGAQGGTRASAILRQGMQVDLRVVPHASFGAALQYFTGSQAHNIALRKLAQERDLKMNEYGVFAGTRQVAGETEEAVFQALGLPYIAPELREDRGEIAAAQAGALPQLVMRGDLRGDLHVHTMATDGSHSLPEMAQAAQSAGLEYIAITDYTHRLTVARGLDAGGLARQIDEIDSLNATMSGFTILKGTEVDIDEQGKLDLPDSLLARLDVVVVAVHSAFGLSRERQTTRILRALDHPYCTLLAHPSGRLLLDRAAYDVDMARVITHARQRGCFMELNAQPSRLDLDDSYCRLAKSEGVLVSINSDAHSIYDFSNLRYGIGQARRGWLEAPDILNTRPINALRALLRVAPQAAAAALPASSGECRVRPSRPSRPSLPRRNAGRPP
jgi:DNA polymerase (family 10)